MLRTARNFVFESSRWAGFNDKPGLTRQSEVEGTDINRLVERFLSTGSLPLMVPRPPLAGDFSSVGSYQDCLNIILDAQEAFMALPAKIRARFKNDAGEYVKFCSDPANLEEMKELGIVDKDAEVPPPVRVEVVNEIKGGNAANAGTA